VLYMISNGESPVKVQGLTWFRVVLRPLGSAVASAGGPWKEMARTGCTTVVGGCGRAPSLKSFLDLGEVYKGSTTWCPGLL